MLPALVVALLIQAAQPIHGGCRWIAPSQTKVWNGPAIPYGPLRARAYGPPKPAPLLDCGPLLRTEKVRRA